MSTPQNRQPPGRPTGGEYAPTVHAEPDVALTPAEAPADAAAVLAANTGRVDLRFVDRGDRLTEDQIEMLLAGNWDEAQDEVDEAFADDAYTQAVEIAREELEAACGEGRFDRTWDELDSDEQDEARYAVLARDQSDPITDLLRNTPKQLMRTSIGNPAGRLADRDAVWGSRLDRGGLEHRRNTIAAMLSESGMDVSTPEAQEAITELVENGPWDWHEGVQLDVIFYDEIDSVLPTPRCDADENAGHARGLEFKDPHVLLIDKWNGSGHDTVVPGTLRRTLGIPEYGEELDQTRRVYLDSKAGGYSWDKVCGLYQPAYADGAPTTGWAVPA